MAITGRQLTMAFVLVLALLPVTGQAQAGVAGAFAQGRTHFSIYGGNGQAFDDEYFVIGVSGSYYFANGFNIGLAIETWTGGSPAISKVSPSLQYVFYQLDNTKPYVGVFYRRAYIENLPDLESVGARAGVFISSGNNAYFGLGGVVESYLDCDETTYRSCHDSYPEVSFTIAF